MSMLVEDGSFAAHQLEAARRFAHTMIVVDDEASQDEDHALTSEVGRLRRPDRATAKAGADPSETAAPPDAKLSLNARLLIQNAMELGLICSVLRPGKRDDIVQRVKKAAEHVDIVCLDWEMYDDEGKVAKTLITEITRSDAIKGGRLRLIAIYTGQRNRQGILNDVLAAFSEKERASRGIKKLQDTEIQSNDGLRIVYFFKAHGTKLPDDLAQFQVSEDVLPARLLREFAELSDGLLSNVALATVAAIRAATHHIVSKFNNRMDGPYFHHRATIESPDEAEDYAVEIVLSELKSAIDKESVASRFAGGEAVSARIRQIAANRETLRMYLDDNDDKKYFDLEIPKTIELIVDGYRLAYERDLAPNMPSKKKMEDRITSLFGERKSDASLRMLEFASLTGVRAHPGSYPFKNGGRLPELGLGSVVREDEKQYWICLQASCDTLRLIGDTNFIFAPLRIADTKPEHVVPILNDSGKTEYLGLTSEKKAYSKTISIVFSPDVSTQRINASKSKDGKRFLFKGSEGREYTWIADLKRKRALRVAQRLGQEMGRLGFDEFEPFRQS